MGDTAWPYTLYGMREAECDGGKAAKSGESFPSIKRAEVMNPWTGMAILYTAGLIFGVVWIWLCGGFE